jgi:hypothetical protein
MKLLKYIYWIIFPLILFILDVVLNIENFFMRTFTTSAIAFFFIAKKEENKNTNRRKNSNNLVFFKRTNLFKLDENNII